MQKQMTKNNKQHGIYQYDGQSNNKHLSEHSADIEASNLVYFELGIGASVVVQYSIIVIQRQIRRVVLTSFIGKCKFFSFFFF